MTDLLVGVVGCGYWGQNHVRVLSQTPGVEVVAIDFDPVTRSEMRRRFPGITTHSTLEEIAADLDAVVVASPPATHELVAAEALEADCHVLVEKPFATSSDACRRLDALARHRDLRLMVGHTYDYHPVVGQLADRVAQGGVGEVRYLDSARLSVGGYRSDVNVLWDMAPHDIVIMRRVMGCWPTRVSAWCLDHTGFGMPDVGMMRLEFEHPHTVGYIRVSWLDPVKVRRFTIVGSEQTAIFNDVVDPERPLRLVDTASEPRLGEGTSHPLPPGYDDVYITTPSVHQAEPLAAQMAHFLHCVRSGSEPRTGAEEGLRIVEILEAADRSVETGQAIELATAAEIHGVA